MTKKKSRQLPVLSIAFVTGEKIEPKGLPKLKVYEKGEDYILVEGYQEIESALMKSIKHLRESDHTLVFLAVEIVPETEGRRTKRKRGSGVGGRVSDKSTTPNTPNTTPSEGQGGVK